MKENWVVVLLGLCAGMMACNGLNSIKSALTNVPPYEEYLRSLDQAQLLRTPMGRAWVEAGEKALVDSIEVSLPFVETGFFQADKPEARSYVFDIREGQVLTVEGDVKTKVGAQIFQDLFVWKEGKWDPMAHADSTFSLRQEFRKDQICLLRIQPELLVNAYYSIHISVTPVLINPVTGASNRSIGSFYGDPRDGGQRSHEGVDIFAARGTPVVAPTDGYITRTGNTRLGGKVVWMRDRERGHAYYFAHLDSQMVQMGMYVSQGDTLGTVGNTGNARTTPPHLHFGIYQSGSKDPLSYIQTMENIVERLPADTAFQSLVYKVSAARLNLRSGPGEKHPIKEKLDKDNYLKIIGKSDDWYRISLPDDRQGFVFARLVVPAEHGTPRRVVGETWLFTGVLGNAVPVTKINDSSSVELLANFQDFSYVKTSEGFAGWIRNDLL